MPVLTFESGKDRKRRAKPAQQVEKMIHETDAGDLGLDQDQKQVALGYVTEAWQDGIMEGVDGDCLAQACLFAAFAELVATYGEDAAAKFAEGLGNRIRNGEFSLHIVKQ
jgi:hypothetical protein